MLRWGVPCAGLTVALSLVAVWGGMRPDPAAPAADGTIAGLTSILEREVDATIARLRFEEVASAAGIVVRHFPFERASLLPEDMGSGAAWGDYDDDGDPDLFVANFGAPLRGAPDAPDAARCALYRNEGDGTFADVTEAAGLAAPLRAMGAAWGDFDGDGDLDLYVTAHGPNRLYRNDAGRFVDVAAAAGVDDDGFGAGAAWADYDADGDLDLYVCNYVAFAFRDGDRARTTRQYGSEIPYTINPSSYPPAPNRLYRNDGAGRFVDAAEDAGVANPTGRSLGAAWFHFDDDGLIDLYVANDVSSNGVFRNEGDGTFSDIGASSLAADYRGAMGMAVGDVDGDDDCDLLVTHWIAQENALFTNMWADDWRANTGERRLFFMDEAENLGLGQISLKMVGWSTGLHDLDDDGLLDLWVVNGNTLEDPDDVRRLKPQAMQVFRQVEDKGFFEVAGPACPALAEPFVGRGGAAADYDGDGRIDLLAMRHGDTPLLLHNTTPDVGHWIALRLRQDGGNTRALGAVIHVRAGDRTWRLEAGADGAYLSQHDGDLHLGLGAHDRIDAVDVRWPDALHGPAAERFAVESVDRVVALRRGSGGPPAAE